MIGCAPNMRMKLPCRGGHICRNKSVRQRDDEYETEASDGQDQVGQEDPHAPLPG